MGIRKLRQLQDEALEKYHREYNRLEEEIATIRSQRGTVLVKPVYDRPWYTPGKDRRPEDYRK